MDKKQKDALIIALAEKGKTYREITKEVGVSPNTIKAVLNKAGLDESASISSRAFELFAEGKSSLQVAITLNLEAEVAIQYHQQYFMLLGCTEFTKVYLQIKDNPWPYVNLVKLVQNARMGDGEVTGLLRIANGHLPRVRLEYDRCKEEKSSLQAELNSWKAELNNIARTYQQFVDRNITLKKREDELQLSISELEAKKDELQKATAGPNQILAELQINNIENTINPEVKQEDIISTNDVFIPSPNRVFNYYRSENKTLHYPPQVEPSSRTLIFDTKDLFPTKAQNMRNDCLLDF
jgi:predicted transcriptional regulator